MQPPETKQLITPELIERFPNMSETARNWISYIPKCHWVSDYFRGLNEALNHLKRKQRESMIKRLVDPKEEVYHQTIAELAYILLWEHLGLSFEKDQRVDGRTPDFKISFANSFFFCDVTAVRHNHPHEPNIIKPPEDLNTPLPIPETPIEQSKRFLMKINEKSKKYKQICVSYNAPLVVAFFQYRFEDQIFLHEPQLWVALFGDLRVNFETGEVYHRPKIINTAHGESKVGVFMFDEYRHVAAAIVCEQKFYRTSNELQQNPIPHYPQKARFTFDIYTNPFGAWADKITNPFPDEGFPIDGLIDIQFKTIYAQVVYD